MQGTIIMRTHLRLKNRQARRLPDAFREQDVRYADELVERFLRQHTRPGDLVLDPFAGFGTTLLVAEEMGRLAYGTELDPERARYIRGEMRHPERLVHGDARLLASYNLPRFDFSMTSPPYMSRNDPEDPLAAYAVPGRGYGAYLQDLAAVYVEVAKVMRPGAKVVVEVSNLKDPDGVTTLAWDVARAIGGVLRFEGEVVICWDRYAYGYDHSYCLLFACPG